MHDDQYCGGVVRKRVHLSAVRRRSPGSSLMQAMPSPLNLIARPNARTSLRAFLFSAIASTHETYARWILL
jgi:hypothetical protein